MELLFGALRYGAIGLGLALAVLAYRLLAADQQRVQAERRVGPVYLFMVFSTALVGAGLYAEWKRNSCYDISELRATVEQVKVAHENGRKAVKSARGVTSGSDAAMASWHAVLDGWLGQTDPAVVNGLNRQLVR